ncbi:Pyridoxal phosphate phosphatase YigL [Arsenophonus endosymbiont of Bemisia tabaci Q2]|nr:Pyridoxal phosphate phosphatase YigL [Arsenophonus endosymbiont of Bemisia tabaci Q2]
MTYSVVASDLDGTLLSPDHTLPLYIAKRLNFDYIILSANKISFSHPNAIFLHLACAHLCSIGLRTGE